MESKFNRFLASPLEKTLEYFHKNNLDYELKEIKPPFKYKDDLCFKKTKRVLKISEKADKFIITWSFQYIS